HVGSRLEKIRKQIAIGLEQRVVGFEDVEVDRSVVGIDGSFYGIPDVIELANSFEADLCGVGMDIGGHVSVENPLQAAGVRKDEIRIRVPGGKVRHRAHPRHDIAADHHAAVLGKIAGQQNVDVFARDGGGNAREERGDGEAALAL